MHFHVFVTFDEWHCRAYPFIYRQCPLPKSLTVSDAALSKINSLRRTEQFEAKNGFEVFRDLPQFKSGREPHRNVVFDIRGTRYRIDARRVCKDLILGTKRGRGVLHDHETRVEPSVFR